MSFVKFARHSVPPDAPPWATVQQRGYLSFNGSAYEALGSPEYVELFYDPEKKRIGLQGSVEETQDAYAVRFQSLSKTRIVAIRAFITFFRLELPASKRYQVTFEDGMMIIDLTEEGQEVVGPRSKAHEA